MRRAILLSLGLFACGQGKAPDALHDVPVREAPASFRFVPAGDGWEGRSGALGFRIDDALRLRVHAEELAVSVACAGRVSGCRPSPTRSVKAAGNRLLLKHEALDEWYVNDPSGLEQGFVVAKPPEGKGAPSARR